MANNPLIEFEVDQPRYLNLVKHFKDGKSRNGDDYHAWEVIDTQNKTTYAWFIYDDKIHGVVLDHQKLGHQIMVVQKAGKNKDTGRPYFYFEVREATLFDPNGNLTQGQKSPKFDDKTLDNYRDERKKMYLTALSDAADVISIFNSDEEINRGFRLSSSDVRELATHFSINFERKHG